MSHPGAELSTRGSHGSRVLSRAHRLPLQLPPSPENPCQPAAGAGWGTSRDWASAPALGTTLREASGARLPETGHCWRGDLGCLGPTGCHGLSQCPRWLLAFRTAPALFPWHCTFSMALSWKPVRGRLSVQECSGAWLVLTPCGHRAAPRVPSQAGFITTLKHEVLVLTASPGMMGEPKRSRSQSQPPAASASGPTGVHYRVAGTCQARRSRVNCRAQASLKNNTLALENNSQEPQGHICRNGCSSRDNRRATSWQNQHQGSAPCIQTWLRGRRCCRI